MFNLWTSVPVDGKWHSCGPQQDGDSSLSAECSSKIWHLLETILGGGEGTHWEVKKGSTGLGVSSCGAHFLRAQLQQCAEDELTQSPGRWVSCASAVPCWVFLSLISQHSSYLPSRSFRCCSADRNQPLIGFGIKSTLRYWIFFPGFWSLLLYEIRYQIRQTI